MKLFRRGRLLFRTYLIIVGGLEWKVAELLRLRVSADTNHPDYFLSGQNRAESRNVFGVAEFFYNTRNFFSRSSAGLEGYLPLALGYLVLTIPIAWLSHWLERRFRHET